MKASYNWLRSLVPQLKDTPEALAARLTAAGLEVESIRRFGEGIETCELVAVKALRPHPSKSGLRLVTVDRGVQGTIEVVCGAPNVPEPGGMVVFAPLGTHLPAVNITIAPRAIGGVTSEGMLCSEVELGLSDEGQGILVFPPTFAKPGSKFVEAVPSAQDVVLEIGLTPNRADCLGHRGLAREIAALYGFPFEPPPPQAPAAMSDAAADKAVQVSIDDTERCFEYVAAVLTDVQVAPSPLWLRYRLSALGVRSISNIVDLTNLVMFEFGHPMHAFDLERVQGATIRVRRARAGETLKTLDGVERHLDEDDLVICDAAGPVALAGVMGGGHSEVANTTRRILLEVASFDPRSVRRTGRRHGLHTESSHRFERGIDHGDSSVVMATAMSMGIRLAGGAALRGTVKATGKALAPVVVRLRSARLNAMLGIVVPFAEAKGILARLGFQLKDVDGTTVEAVVPSHRPDITREVDLIEEVIRVRGLETVPAVLPSLHASRPVGNTEALMARVRSAAVGVGLSEAVTFSFVSPRDLEIVGAPPAAVLLRNPLSENQSVMRTSLLPGLLAALGHARRHGEKDVRLFTVGRIFLKGQGEGLPREQLSFAAILAGHRGAHLSKPAPLDAWDLKGVAEGFVERFAGLKPNSEAYPLEQRPAHLHPKAAVLLALGGRPLGHFGLLHPDVTDALDLGTEVFAVELDVEALAKEASTSRTYKAIPRFPGSTRDLAVVVHEDILAGHVEAAVREAAGTLAESIEVFDRFVGGSLPQDHASLALRIVYRRHDRTLTDAEVDTQHASVVEAVTKRFSASLRA